MKKFGYKNSITDFFRDIYGNDFVDCEEYHLCASEIKEIKNKRGGETETCCFNEMVINALESRHLEKATIVCDNWKQSSLDIILCLLIRKGVVEANESCGGWETNDWNRLIRNAARMGCLELFKLCEEKKRRTGNHVGYDFVLCYAAFHGFADIVSICKKRGACNLSKAMRQAAKNGHVEIVKLCKEWGANNFEDIICDVGVYGQIEILKLLKEWDVGDLVWALYSAAKHGQIECVKMYKEWGLTNFSVVMQWAAEGGQFEVVDLCKRWGAKSFSRTMVKAAVKGHIEIVKLCKKWGAQDFDDAMCCAARYGHIEIVKLCKTWGATAFHRTLLEAARKGHNGIAELCREWRTNNLAELRHMEGEQTYLGFQFE